MVAENENDVWWSFDYTDNRQNRAILESKESTYLRI